MHDLTSDTIRRALDEVERSFPFEGYITRGHREQFQAVISLMAPHLPTTDRIRLLDVGCGPMDKTAALQILGFDCVAIDDLRDPWHENSNTRQAIRRFSDDFGIAFHSTDLHDFPSDIQTQSFHIVTIFDVIEHLHRSPRHLLDLVGRYLKQAGLLVITMPNSVNLRKRLAVLTGKSNYPPITRFFHSNGPWRGHVREYTLEETSYIVREAGFEVAEAAMVEGFAFDKLKGPALHLYLQLTRVLPTLRSKICVIGRKPADWNPPRE